MGVRENKGLALLLAAAVLLGLLSGCSGAENTAVFRAKETALRETVLTDQLRQQLEQAPAGEAGYAVFFSACDGTRRASVCHGAGETLDAAWDAAAQAMEREVKQGGSAPLWLKADVVYVSSALSAGALEGIGEVFGPGGFRYGLALDPAFETAFLEAELNTAGIYDYEKGGVDLERLNAYLKETGRASVNALPERCTAFQCAGWLCGEDNSVVPLSLEETAYGRREYSAVDGEIAAALAQDGAEYLAAQVREDGSIVLYGGEALPIPRHADALRGMLRGYRRHPSEALAGSIDRAADWLASQIAYTEQDMGFFLDQGEITLEDSALGLIALSECAEVSGNDGYLPVCRALGAGLLSLLDAETGRLTHVLNAEDLSRKEEFRAAAWDSMGAAALCRLYGMTEDSLWLWAAELVQDRILTEEPAGVVWTAYALPEFTTYVQARTASFVYALKNAQGSLASIYSAQGTEPAGLEMLLLSYETYRRMLDAGYSTAGFSPDLLLEVVSARAMRQLDGYLFPEYAMYYAEPEKVLGAFMDREKGLGIDAEGMCRNINGYDLYAAQYETLLADGMPKVPGEEDT